MKGTTREPHSTLWHASWTSEYPDSPEPAGNGVHSRHICCRRDRPPATSWLGCRFCNARQNGARRAVKLASNETVFGPLCPRPCRHRPGYRHGQPLPTTAACSSRPRWPGILARTSLPKHVAVGCGSVSLCQQLVRVTASVGKWSSAGAAFRLLHVGRVAGAIPIQVRWPDPRSTLYAMLATVTSRCSG